VAHRASAGPGAQAGADHDMHAAVRSRVDAFVRDLASAPWYDRVSAVVVSGSAARGEEIWDGTRLVSDIDMMVVTRSESPRLARAISGVIERHAASGIDGGRIPVRALRSYRTVAFYEAKFTGCVVAGRSDCLAAIPMTGPLDIPRWEGLRLVANRLFEHVKLAAGVSDATTCARKSYEAIGEAQLITEGRYRPSFRARLAELSKRPSDSPVPALGERYEEAVRARFSRDTDDLPEPGRALDDLVRQLGAMLMTETGVSGPAGTQLDALSRQRRNLVHRAVWALSRLRQRRFGREALMRDPAIGLWADALSFLEGNGQGLDAHRLYSDWIAAPQPLIRRNDRTR